MQNAMSDTRNSSADPVGAQGEGRAHRAALQERAE